LNKVNKKKTSPKQRGEGMEEKEGMVFVFVGPGLSSPGIRWFGKSKKSPKKISESV
jgi:hypothetical protein